MPRPNKLLMGIASLLGAYTGKKRQEEDFLKRLNLRNALEEQQWQRRNKEQEQQALNRLLFSKGFSPGQEDEYFQSQQKKRQLDEQTQAHSVPFSPTETQKLFNDLLPWLETYEGAAVLEDPRSYELSIMDEDDSDYEPSFLAMKGIKDEIALRLHMDNRFPLKEAEIQASRLAPLIAKQRFLNQNPEREVGGLDLIDTAKSYMGNLFSE
jgi:hypothetical protein